MKIFGWKSDDCGNYPLLRWIWRVIWFFPILACVLLLVFLIFVQDGYESAEYELRSWF